jgi:hypothetical protein
MQQMSGIMKQLHQERVRLERQLAGINAALTAFAGVYTGAKPARKGRKLSAAGRVRIAAAQRKRWAKFKRRRRNRRQGQ